MSYCIFVLRDKLFAEYAVCLIPVVNATYGPVDLAVSNSKSIERFGSHSILVEQQIIQIFRMKKRPLRKWGKIA